MLGSLHIKSQVIGLLGGILLASSGLSQPVAATSPARPPVAPPPLPAPRSGIDFFRRLLSAKPAERETLLAAKSAEEQRVLLGSVREYESLSPGEQESRLHELELRLHLSAMMRMPPTNRAVRLQLVPPPLLPLVSDRLLVWDKLTSAEQKAVLDYERAMRVFVPTEPGRPGNDVRLAGYTALQLSQLEKDIARWKELPAGQQKKTYDHFEKILGTPLAKGGKTSGGLNEAERHQMEKTLAVFRQMPKMQREVCIGNFSKFAEMSPTQRRQFLKDAELWSQMKPEERQLWRDLVKKVPPMPPMPPGFGAPPPPPLPRPLSKTSVATTNP